VTFFAATFFLIGFGFSELAIIGAILFLLFGASKLPKLARSLGESIVEFKRGVKGTDDDDEDEKLPPAEKSERVTDGKG
jgi:sec-independent protein translocase protein TatA